MNLITHKLHLTIKCLEKKAMKLKKTLQNSFSSRIEITEDRISQLRDRPIKFTQAV